VLEPAPVDLVPAFGWIQFNKVVKLILQHATCVSQIAAVFTQIIVICTIIFRYLDDRSTRIDR
jgi:hypothetical protein